MVRARNPSLMFLSETLPQPVALESLRISPGFTGCICDPCENEVQEAALLWKDDLNVKLRRYGPNHIDDAITYSREIKHGDSLESMVLLLEVNGIGHKI
ncbi:hypothetical protein ACLB2K_073476 [Fragaria x ananassa]